MRRSSNYHPLLLRAVSTFEVAALPLTPSLQQGDSSPPPSNRALGSAERRIWTRIWQVCFDRGDTREGDPEYDDVTWGPARSSGEGLPSGPLLEGMFWLKRYDEEEGRVAQNHHHERMGLEGSLAGPHVSHSPNRSALAFRPEGRWVGRNGGEGPFEAAFEAASG